MATETEKIENLQKTITDLMQENDRLRKQLALNDANGGKAKQIVKKLADGNEYVIDAYAFAVGFRTEVQRSETDKEYLSGVLAKKYGFIKKS
jgi:hypothetical protein